MRAPIRHAAPLAALCALVALLLVPGPARAQPAADPYVDYAAVLARYVSDGAVDYARLKADNPPEWRRFLAWLAAADPARMSLADQRAFWINAYNARVIAGVVERYPIDSVRDVGFLGGRIHGFFGLHEHPVAGHRRSLDDIEKGILLGNPLWDDRVHWALTCASRGCPDLRPEPYRGADLDMQLDFQARTYLNGPRGSRLDRDSKTLYLTRIFDWYRADFVRAAGSIRDYAARYLTGLPSRAARDSDYSIEWIEYDWALNDAR